MQIEPNQRLALTSKYPSLNQSLANLDPNRIIGIRLEARARVNLYLIQISLILKCLLNSHLINQSALGLFKKGEAGC